MSTLSLLSRGNAQVVKTTQERIEIHYEPEDYFNWRSRHDFQLRRYLNGKYTSQYHWEIPTHKTYSTKKGPLVLYSEDMALPAWNFSQDRRGHRSHRYKRKKFKIELSTLLDLSGAILSYGRKQNGHTDSNWQPYLHFLNEEDIHYNRQIRPGYSPKRYLTRLLQTWDPNYLYKLQQAGSLRDSVQLQQLTSYSGENSRRHPDLSSTPLKYQRLPTYLPHWTNTDAPGCCTPVEEETGNEEDLATDNDILEVYGKQSAVPLSSTGTFRKSSPERTKSHVTQSSWKTKEQYNLQPQGEIPLSQINRDDTISNRTDYYEKPPVPLEVLFEQDNPSLTHGKPHTTFYGGPFNGRRKYPYGKQELMRLHNENTENLPDGTFLPPISKTVGLEPEVMRDTKIQEQKLPPIMEEASRVPQRKMRHKAADPPKELIVIPLLVRFENQKVTQGEKTNTNGKAMAMNNEKDHKPQSHAEYMEEPADITLEENIPNTEKENRIKTLQMDIEWNLDPTPDGNLPPDAPPLSLLPPINGKKRSANQSSMANLKAPSGSSNNTLSSKGQSLPTGIIRGSLPEELKECCKGGSVGSLIMSPNGEIVCLSLMGAARDTDLPIRFDFIPENDEQDCLQLESAGQEEQWSGSQKDSEKEMDGSESSVRSAENVSGKTTSPQSHKETLRQTPKKRQRKITDPQTDIQGSDDVSDFQPVAEEITEKANVEKATRREKKKEMHSDENTDNKTKKEFTNGEVSSNNTPVTVNIQESSNNSDALSLQAIDAVTEENDVQYDKEMETSTLSVQRSSQSSHKSSQSLQQDTTLLHKRPQVPTDVSGRNTPIEEAEAVSSQISTDVTGRKTPAKESEVSIQPIKDSETILNNKPQAKSDTTSTRRILEKVKTNDRPPSGKAILKNEEEKIVNAEATTPSAVKDDHSNAQDSNIKDTKKQIKAIQKVPEVSPKDNSPKESEKIKKTPKINKDVERDANENKDKPSSNDPQAEVTPQKSPPEKQPMTEEEEMAILQEITSTAKKEEVVKVKSKKKSKPEKTSKPEKNQAKTAKKTNQGSATEGKAAFVVGQPKDKKAETKISYPKKSSDPVQKQEIQEKLQEIEEEGSDSEKESEDSYVVTKHVKRSPSPTEDLPSDTGVTQEDEEQSVHKPTTSTLMVTNPTNEEEYAYSETSEATSSSVYQQKTSRARELSEKAERRRLEVEKKRREREEQLRLEKEQQERMERMKEELEEEQRCRAEELRLRKQQEEEERQRQEQERLRRLQMEHQALERARQQQEEYRRKLQDIQRRKQQEELERIALERQRQQEQERLEAEERMRLLEMAEDEREEYQRKKREREEQARQEAERQRLMAEAEARALMEEAQRQAQLLARQTAALEQQLQFNRGLMKESIGMDQTQGVSRPWVFSYFEFLELLGLPLPVEGEST